MGDIPEEQMIKQWYPGGTQPITSKPKFIPNALSNPCLKPIEGSAKFKSPTTIRLYSATQGASIAYTTEKGKNSHWLLYSGPISLKKGNTTLRSKAIRYGYQESEEAIIDIIVE